MKCNLVYLSVVGVLRFGMHGNFVLIYEFKVCLVIMPLKDQ